MTIAVDRFERRLTSDISTVRGDVSRDLSTLRVDVSRELATLRIDVARDISALRVELLKWSFLFWIGQAATTAGMLAFMLRP